MHVIKKINYKLLYSIKKYSSLLSRINSYYFFLFFFLSTLLVGYFTVPRFGDGIFHLEVAKSWFETGVKPIFVCQRFVSEAPLWYFGVQLLSKVFGGFNHFSAQLLQSIFFTGILILAYKITYLQTKSDITAKIVLLFTASTPMLAVTTILCFIDIICAFFVLLSIWFLLNKKNFWSILACVGVWYSKRTGVLELVVFFSFFVVYILQLNKKNYQKSIITLFKYGMIFLAFIFPDIIYRFLSFGLLSSYEVNFSSLTTYSTIKIMHSAQAAKAIPINDYALWLGGTTLSVFLLFPFGIVFMIRRKLLKQWFKKNYPLLYIFSLTVIIFAFFCLGRITIRYWAIVIALSLVSTITLLIETKLRHLIFLLSIAAIIQYSFIMFYILQKRQISVADRQVLDYLKKINNSKDIAWYEARFGRFYLHREIFWEKYLTSLLQLNCNSEVLKQDLGAIVITKRYLYNYKDIYYDRGIPFHILEKMKKTEYLKLAFENEKYYIFIPSSNNLFLKPVKHSGS